MRVRRDPATLRHLTEPPLGSAPPLAQGLRRQRILEPILFGEGSDELDTATLAQLEEQAGVLAWFVTAGEIEVLGYAWGEGDRVHCGALEQRRAEAVAAALVRLGVPAWVLRARGCCTEQPARVHGGPDDAANSRRVELWLCQRGRDLTPPP